MQFSRNHIRELKQPHIKAEAIGSYVSKSASET